MHTMMNNKLNIALISESRLKLALCNSLTHLLKGITQTLCFIIHYSFGLIYFSLSIFFN